MAIITKPFGGASTDSGGRYNFNVTYSTVNPRTGANGKWVLIQSEASRPPSVFAADDTAGINTFLDSTTQNLGNYLNTSLNDLEQAQRNLDAATQAGNTAVAENARIKINYYNKEISGTRQNLAASQAVSSEVNSNAQSALADLTAAEPESTSSTTNVNSPPSTASTTVNRDYKSARQFADPVTQKNYDDYMKQQSYGLWDDPETQAEAAAEAERLTAQQRQEQSSTAPVNEAASQTAGDQVANTQGTVAPTETAKEQALRNYNEVAAERGAPPVGIDDANFNASYARVLADNPGLAEEASNVEAGRNSGRSTSDFIESDELPEEQASRVTNSGTDSEDYEEFQTVPDSVASSSRTAQQRDGWRADGSYGVTISGVNQQPTNTVKSPNTQVTNVTPNIPTTYVPSPNPLHAYASYTYGMSLHVLSDQEYTAIANNPGARFKPKLTIISAANRYNVPKSQGGTRDSAFTDDFYFNDFKMNTTVGLNHETRGGNTLTVSFTLIEPYGMTFVNRLLDLSVRLGKPNYTDIPYMLEINFFGADDTGKYANLENHTKLIPIRIMTVKIRAGTKGSEYIVEAIPYCKVASMQSLSVAKANFEITSKTVGDFFKSGAAGANQLNQTVSDQQRDLRQRETEAARARSAIAASGGPGAQIANPGPIKIVSSSFADAFNVWNTQAVSHGIMQVADEVVFDIDSAIASATIVDPVSANPANAPIQMNDGAFLGETNTNSSAANKNNIAKSGSPKSAGADFSRSIFNVNAGTSIMTVLNNIIINSTFVTNQLANSETKPNKVTTAEGVKKATGGKKNVEWFKITTKVELKGYDAKRGYSGKKLTYFVRRYTHYNVSSPDAPKSQPVGAIKDYNYIYTGKNLDILDFSIEFNYLFNSLAIADKSKQTELSQSPGTGSANQTQGSLPSLPNYSISPTQMIIQSGHQTVLTGGHEESSIKQQSAVLAENIYIGAAGDFIELNLKITGDPQFIKQDEILYSADKLPLKANQFVDRPGGSLAMDTGEIFCKLTFKTPVDIDETTGLLRTDSAWKEAYFSGLYKVMTVVSEFRQGKFTQELKLIRHREQPGDSKAKGNTASTNSAEQRAKPPGADDKPEVFRNDDGSILIIHKNGDVQAVDNTPAGNLTTRYADRGGEFQAPPATNAATNTAATVINNNNEDFPVLELADATPQPVPAGVVVTSTETGETTVVTNAGGAATSVSRRRRPVTARDVAVNGATVPIDNNSDPEGQAAVGVITSPVQTATLDSQTDPVQTEPRAAPATEAERQSDAATAELDKLQAELTSLEQQYETLYAAFAPKRDQLKSYDKVLADIENLLTNVSPNSEQQAKLLALQVQSLTAQNQLLAGVNESVKQMTDIKSQADVVNNRIRTIKSNTGNTQ